MLATLRPIGYQFVTFATGFEPTEHPAADRYLSPHPHTTEFQRMVIDMTPARVIWPDPRQLDRFRQARDRITYLLDHLPEVARDPRPTFTFAHCSVPIRRSSSARTGEDIGHEHERFMLYQGDKINGRFREPEYFRRGLSRPGGLHHAEDPGDDRSHPGRVARAADHHRPVGPRLGVEPRHGERRAIRTCTSG